MENGERPGASVEVRIAHIEGERRHERFDAVATEEPLEIRLRTARERRTVAVTMRTPGNDFELAAGFLFAEGILAGRESLAGISYCVDREVDVAQRFNIVNVDLAGDALPALERLERHFAMTSACGVCGKANLEALAMRGLAALDDPARIDPATIALLPERLRAAQGLFATTGGLHAAALFSTDGTLVAVREDVGRHNALDKLLGWALLAERLPLAGRALLVSGRASYELVQKALAGGIPIVCSISAPSSLAIETARTFGLTLVGFVNGTSANVYAGEERVGVPATASSPPRRTAGTGR